MMLEEGESIGGFRITELLHGGTWDVYRGERGGTRAIVTTMYKQPPAGVLDALALPFEGILPLIGTEVLEKNDATGFAIIEREPAGWRICDLKWPLPIAEVIAVGLDLARVLSRMHAAGVVHGSVRPQTVWIDVAGGITRLSGTTPRPERVGVHCLSQTRTGNYSPFVDDMFLPDVLARAEPASFASDVAQLGMMLYRMATHVSPFRGTADESMMQQLVRAIEGDIVAPWPAGDERTNTVEALARGAIRHQRSLAQILDELARLPT
jgi:hypothetical protein